MRALSLEALTHMAQRRRSHRVPVSAVEVKPTAIKDWPKATIKPKAKTRNDPFDIVIKPPEPKNWPDDDTVLLDYEDLAWPLKSIILQGYRLLRNDKKDFDYNGYNIGPQ